MGLGELANCPKCGKLFTRSGKNICPACYEKTEAECQKCIDFLKKKENRMANILEVSEGTGVSVSKIKMFIREGRLSLADNPNLGIPCEKCGKLIKQGMLCESCAGKLQQGFSASMRSENKKKWSNSGAAYRARDRE